MLYPGNNLGGGHRTKVCPGVEGIKYELVTILLFRRKNLPPGSKRHLVFLSFFF